MTIRQAQLSGSGSYIEGEAVLIDQASIEQLRPIRALLHVGLLSKDIEIVAGKTIQVIFKFPMVTIDQAEKLADRKAAELNQIVAELHHHHLLMEAVNIFVSEEGSEKD